MKVALLHGYSAENSGDGLLVEESLGLIREAFGASVEVDLFASYPESFERLGLRTYLTKPTRRGYDPDYRAVLRSGFARYDLLVGVGGGYLRAPGGTMSLKTGLVMLPQLRAAAHSSVPSVYLPQSVGPLRGPIGAGFRHYVAGINVLHLRDERSVAEVGLAHAVRTPDLAILGLQPRDTTSQALADTVPVFNARTFRGDVLTERVGDLRRHFDEVDGLVQSSVASNDDRPSVAALEPRGLIVRDEFYEVGGGKRVVVAMRLHCALQSLNAGHYVVHLAYERKGFGAFRDLGIPEYVHPVGEFDVPAVRDQVRELIDSPDARCAYDAAVSEASSTVGSAREGVIASLRRAAGARA